MTEANTRQVASEARVLCIGDLHAGRRSTRIDGDMLAGSSLAAADLTPTAAWSRLVEAAIERDVDAVLLLGDVVDARNDLFESAGPIERGVRRLAGRGIPTYAIVGNHDVRTLPRLADGVEGLELIGRAGTWEERLIGRPGRPQVRVVGWSFPAEQVRESPLASMPPELRAGAWRDPAANVATLGLLHADLDVLESRHAPVRRAELEAVPVDAWLLGHIHVPDSLEGARPTGYLGSVVPLDPKEAGWRGAWVAHCAPGTVRMERLAVAHHRYETVELDIGTLAGAADFAARLLQATRDRHAAIAGELTNEQLVVARLRLTGAHRDHAGVLAELADYGSIGDARFTIDGVVWAFEPRVRDASRPALDLAALAARRDLASPIAQQLQAAGGVDPARRDALRAHLRAAVLASPSFRDLDDNDAAISDAALDVLLRDGATLALHAVEAHRRSVDGAAEVTA